jgi:hypothetical protein
VFVSSEEREYGLWSLCGQEEFREEDKVDGLLVGNVAPGSDAIFF